MCSHQATRGELYSRIAQSCASLTGQTSGLPIANQLLEKIDVPEGKEVSVTIIDVPSSPDKEAFRRAAGGWKGTVDVETLIKNI